ncbi:MAG: hypothetical protein J6X55_06785, partial [Victivallales bacterium]|nr:hypothetical protein [Victivallales bacterium]
MELFFDEQILLDDKGIRAVMAASGQAPWRFVLKNLDQRRDQLHSIVHLPYSSSWVFTTGPKTKWCLDPFLVFPSTEEEVREIASGLRNFDFCIITHLHRDHFQKELLKEIEHQGTSIQWLVPEWIIPEFCKHFPEAPQTRLIPLRMNHEFLICDIHITAFDGFHFEPNGNGCPSCALAIQLPDGVKLSFPIDTRDYSLPIPAKMKDCDYLFAHIWLGRDCSHLHESPLLKPFCDYCLKFNAKNILIGHILEVMRPIHSM